MTNYTMDKHSLVRTIYLYLFALVGLTLLVIAGVSFINMGLRAYVFTKADEMLRIEYKQPPFGPIAVEKAEQLQNNFASGEKVELTKNEAQQIEQWLADYKNWKEQREGIDPVVVNRQSDAAINLAMIIIGLPLYLFHWRIIRRETKK